MKYLALPLLLLLTACSSAPERPDNGLSPEENWQLRQQQLSQLEQWKLSGRLAVLNDHEAWHMTLEWQQRADHYAMNIIAPLGQGSVQLQGDAHGVVLQTEDEPPVRSASPEALLQQQLGWRVPVSALRYWVRGLAAPGERQYTLDTAGQLTTLQQNGWHIEFFDYTPRAGHALPRKVFVSNPQATVKLVISQWQLLSDQGPHPK